MTDDIKSELGKWFSNCDPLVPLELSNDVDNQRYVPLDAWPDEETEGAPIFLRRHDIVSDLIKEIELRHYHAPPESNLARETIRIAFDGQLPIGTDEVKRAINALEQSRGTIFREVREILATIHETGQLESLSETQLGALAGAMDQQLVLCYCNGESWYDVHPMILRRVASRNLGNRS